MNFNPLRLSIARKRRQLNQKRLAEEIDGAPLTISRWEKGTHVPTRENVQALAAALDFPAEFFYGSDSTEPEKRDVSFRSQKGMTAKVRDAALAAGSIGFLLNEWVEMRFTLPGVKVPDLGGVEPEQAARQVREVWGLGEAPIANMVELLESKGVRVFSLVQNTKTVNAYSLWQCGKPFVFLNTFKSAESSRFDAAHELAHLVLHQDGAMTGREAEDQADQFASAFLMPRADVIACCANEVFSVHSVLMHKKRWKVSAMALNYTLHKIGILSDWRYRDFSIALARMGYRSGEPKGMPRERSMVWGKVLTMLWSEGVTTADIAKQLSLPISEVEDLVFDAAYQGNGANRGRNKQGKAPTLACL